MVPTIPLAIGGAVAAGLVALRLRAVAKSKAATNVIPAPNAPAAPKTPSAAPISAVPILPAVGLGNTIAQAAAVAQGKPMPPATPGAPTIEDMLKSLANPAANAVSFDSVTEEQMNAAKAAFDASQTGRALNSGDSIAAVGQRAIVTTKDPAPEGDLIIRSSPSASAPQIGGAEKNGTVIVLNSSDPVFAQIRWGGGSRLPAATGFARKAFLKLI